MSKLRSQLNYLTSDPDHSGSIEAAPYSENSSPRVTAGNDENHQKLADIKSAIETLTGKLNSVKNIPNREAETPTAPAHTSQENLKIQGP